MRSGSNNNTYRKFDPDTTPFLDSQSVQSQSTAATPSVFTNMPTRSVKIPKRELKSWSALKISTRLQLILAILVILFDSISLGVISNQRFGWFFGACSLGTGIWVGGLGVITGGLGLAAFRTPHGHKCLMIGHFVMSIITIVADGVLIVHTGLCLSGISFGRRSYEYEYESRGEAVSYAILSGLTANESLMLIAVAIHFVSSIVSAAFMCRNMCGGKQPAVTVVYLPPGGSTATSADGVCGVEVPPGAQVIFVQSEGARQNGSTPGVNAL